MNGFLCIDKSPGVTSRDAVNVIQRLIRPVKVGHAGTLDPMATGVLVMALGRCTKLITYVQQMRKVYSAEFHLGKTSDTEDMTGKVTSREVATTPERRDIELVADEFVGPIMQLPPQYSALRVNGKRAHALARAGESVALTPRTVQIYRIAVTQYAFPVVRMDVECGSGTYIRSLGRDIGDRLGCGAVMSALRRTRIGRFGIEESQRVEQLQSEEDITRCLRPTEDGLDLPRHELSPSLRQDLVYGRKIECDFASTPEFAATGDMGKLLAVMKQVEGTVYRPSINFIAE